MNLIYLDYNCFQRGFDDLSQLRIHLESLACQEIFQRAEKKKIQLVWSFMHLDETMLCPISERSHEALRLSKICKMQIGPDNRILKKAESILREYRLSSKDAIHVACAMNVKADYFLTCDDEIIKRTKKYSGKTKIMNPVDFIRIEVIK